MNYNIYSLKDFPDAYSILALWAYNEWFQKSNLSFDIILKDYKRRASLESLPVSFIACSQTLAPIGMVSLKKEDLLSRKDLTPWLSGLYVVPEWRGRGVGTALIERVQDYSRKLGYEEIFLFADRKNEKILVDFYTKLGWNYHSDGNDSFAGKVKVFSCSL